MIQVQSDYDLPIEDLRSLANVLDRFVSMRKELELTLIIKSNVIMPFCRSQNEAIYCHAELSLDSS